MRHSTMRAAVIAVAASLLAAACASQPVVDEAPSTTAPATTTTTVSDPVVRPDDPTHELQDARRRWAAASIDSYSYRFLDDCGECDQLPARSLVVWTGEVADPLDRAVTIEEAFELIEGALESERTVEVTYHPELGHPTDVWIDPEARPYDGGTHLVFDSVEPGLPGADASLQTLRDAVAKWKATHPDAYEYLSAVVCDCELRVEMRTRVVDGLVTEFETKTPEPTDITFSPLTIDQMFDDVEGMLTGETIDAGYRVTGRAAYDDRFGHPVWIGLDLEVVDPEAAEQQPLTDRLVFMVTDFAPLELSPSLDLTEAKGKWSAAGLESYAYSIVFHDIEAADFTDAFTVEVASGAVVSVIQNDYEFGPEGVEGVGTIEELFDEIEAAQRAGRAPDVIYHVDLGYPTVVIASGSGTSVSISLVP